MEEPPAKETPDQGLNKIDLSQLQDFRFGTQWTEIKSAPGPRREREPRREGPERGEMRPRGPAGPDPRRDRRSFRRPAGAPGEQPPPAEGEARPGFHRDEGSRPPGEWRGREGPREGRGPPREGGERRWSGSRPPLDRPYLSPYFNLAFYPEDAGFTALVKAMRGSCRTFELFEIARLILGKFDRFVVVLTRRPPEAPAPAPEAVASDTATPVPPAEPPPPTAARAPNPLYVALPDGVPFETEDAAIAHVVGKHLDKFFDMAVVEVEPPKGSFPFVNRCTLSGELLGPPNYHRYAQIVQQHHALRFARMPFDRFRENIETVRDPEVVNQWLEKMKHTTRYTWKPAVAGEPPATFDNLDDARAHLVATARNRMVKTVESARFHAKVVELLPPGEIRRAIEGQLERQRRFPLDTANALRGRLRREGFTIFKKGAKGISYVCAVKRKFRIPGQSFAQGINTLITFLETNPMITVKELPVKLLGITPPSTVSTPPVPLSMSTPPMPAPPAAEPAAPAATEAPAAPEAATPEAAAPAPAAPPAPAPLPADEAPAPVAPAAPPLAPEDQEKLRRMTMDLRWLVTEGYVTEFADGRLFAPPPIAEARSKGSEADEGEEHDLESFPEVPAPQPSGDTGGTPSAGTQEGSGPAADSAPAAADSATTVAETAAPELLSETTASTGEGLTAPPAAPAPTAEDEPPAPSKD